MKKFLSAVVICELLLLVISGCSFVDKKSNILEESHNQVAITDNPNEHGRVYFDYNTNLIMFLDYELRARIPLCAKPNCRHDDTACSAFIEKEPLGLSIYQNKLYFFLDGILYSSDLSGENRKAIVDTGYKDAGYAEKYIDGKLYMKIDSTMLEEDLINSERVTGIACIELNTGDLEVLIELQDQTDYINFSGVYDNKVFGTVVEQKTIQSDEDEVTLNPFYIDLRTKEQHGFLTHIENLNGYSISDHYATFTCNAWQDEPTEIYALDLDTNECIKIAKGNHLWNNILIDNKQFYFEVENNIRVGLFYYDFITGETNRITSDLDETTILAIGGEYGEDMLWGGITFDYDSGTGFCGETKDCLISKEDYYAGRHSKYIIID